MFWDGRLFLVFVFCLKCLYVYWGGGCVLCLKGKLVIDDWCELDWKSMLFFWREETFAELRMTYFACSVYVEPRNDYQKPRADGWMMHVLF